MNKQKDKESLRARERRWLPFIIEFVKFAAVFVFIIAAALFILRTTSTIVL